MILQERRGAVAVVIFNRPDVLNAMTLEMADAYAEVMRTLDSDVTVRAIVVTGAGRGFCAGADLAVLTQGAESIRRFLPARENLPCFALRLRKPVIVAVNGPVAGVGFAYMLGSDIRFAAPDAKISTTFSRLGLVAEYGLSWLLPRLVGVGSALDLLLSGRTITGDEALRLGLVQYVLPADELLDGAVAYATQLAQSCSPASLATMKAQVYADLDASESEALTSTLELMDASFDGADLAEALVAHTQKRAPVFQPLGAPIPDGISTP